mgnify:CR=1 FL=1
MVRVSKLTVPFSHSSSHATRYRACGLRQGQLLPYAHWADATALDDLQLSGYGDIDTVLLISSSRPRAQLVAAAARLHASR